MNRTLRFDRTRLPFAETNVERNFAFDGFDHLQKSETLGSDVEAKASTGSAVRTDQAMAHEALKDLREEVVPHPGGFGQIAEGRFVVWRQSRQVDRDTNRVIRSPSDLHFTNLTNRTQITSMKPQKVDLFSDLSHNPM
jgi:hypothetical protein